MDFADKVLAELVARIRALEAEIETVIAERRARFHYVVKRNRVWFDGEALGRHRAFRLGLWRQIRQSPLPIILVSPIIYSLIVPVALLDLFLALYQSVCFRAYGIKRVPRADFIVIDRHHLAYLNPLEKLNCVYCGYANGVIAYAREIGARTEEYWCPIKHSRPIATPHSRYLHFVDYGDAEGYRQQQDALRQHAGTPTEPPPKA
ncbi:MAG: hypothetical protein EPN20_07420 [Magnetospirillum sp.]|nr:MAG: hypothetical protein EPN20_07420 [Magnetospirillum sp.]